MSLSLYGGSDFDKKYSTIMHSKADKVGIGNSIWWQLIYEQYYQWFDYSCKQWLAYKLSSQLVKFVTKFKINLLYLLVSLKKWIKQINK